MTNVARSLSANANYTPLAQVKRGCSGRGITRGAIGQQESLELPGITVSPPGEGARRSIHSERKFGGRGRSLQQLLVCALIDQLALSEHHEPIGPANLGQAVGDQERRSALEDTTNCLLNLIFD
jgi:hypothetical protein